MKKVIPILLISVCFFAEIKSQNVNTEKGLQKNLFFLTVGAPSMYTGFSYERLISDKANIKILSRVGFGLNIFKPSLGKEYNLNTGLTGLYGKRKHFAEVGGGFVHYFESQYSIVKEDNYIQYKPILYCLVGYRYNFSKKPLAFKVGITPIFVMNKDKWTFFPLAEIGIGFRI